MLLILDLLLSILLLAMLRPRPPSRRSWNLMLLILDLLLSILLLAMLRPRPPSRSTSSRSEMPRPRLMVSPRPSLLLPMPRLLLTERLLLCRTALRRAVPSLRLLTDRDVLLSRNLLTPMRTLLTLAMSTSPLLLPEGSLSLNSTSSRAILMRCPMRLGFLKRRLPEPWLMLLVLLMSSDVSRSSPWPSRRTRSFLRPSARTPVPVLMRLRSMPSREAERP